MNLNLILKKFNIVVPYLVQILEKRTTWIVTTVLLSVVLGVLFLTPPVDTSPYYDRINSLENYISKLEKKDTLLSEEIDSLQSIQKDLEQKNLVLQHQLDTLTHSYEKNITFVDTASTDQLTEFFADRYRYLLRKTP